MVLLKDEVQSGIIIAQWQEISRPPQLAHLYQCLADGSPATSDPPLQDLEDPPRAIETDDAMRVCIHQRYLHYYRQRYADSPPTRRCSR